MAFDHAITGAATEETVGHEITHTCNISHYFGDDWTNSPPRVYVCVSTGPQTAEWQWMLTDSADVNTSHPITDAVDCMAKPVCGALPLTWLNATNAPATPPAHPTDPDTEVSHACAVCSFANAFTALRSN